MKLRTENPQLAAYVMTKGGQLKAVLPVATEEGVTVIFEVDVTGLGEPSNLREEFYRGRGGILSLAEYSAQLSTVTERMFLAVLLQDRDERHRASSVGHREARCAQ